MQLNKSFLAIGNGQTDKITDICDSRVAFAAKNITRKKYNNNVYSNLFDLTLPCCTQLATENQIQWWRSLKGLSPSDESSSAVSNGENLEMMNIATETATPPASISSQTPVERGARKEKKSIDFSGDATYRIEIPRSKKGIEKSTTCSLS